MQWIFKGLILSMQNIEKVSEKTFVGFSDDLLCGWVVSL